MNTRRQRYEDKMVVLILARARDYVANHPKKMCTQFDAVRSAGRFYRMDQGGEKYDAINNAVSRIERYMRAHLYPHPTLAAWLRLHSPAFARLYNHDDRSTAVNDVRTALRDARVAWLQHMHDVSLEYVEHTYGKKFAANCK